MSVRTVVGRLYRFRATHSLPDFPEPWCFPHEHDYTVEVVAVGGTPTDTLDEWWSTYPTRWPVLDERFKPSTVENIAEWLLSEAPRTVLEVVVWEDRQRWGRAER